MEENNKKYLLAGLFSFTVISISLTAAYLIVNRKRKSPLQITFVQDEFQTIPKSKDIIEDGDSIYIYPPSRDSQPEPTEDELENERLTKYIEDNFPTRFDGIRWSCVHCNISISPHGKYYRCSDCDEYVLCEKCFKEKGEEIHAQNLPSTAIPHTTEFIYSNMCFPGEIKKRLFHTFSCSAVLKKCFEFYKDRKYFGEKSNSSGLSSFRSGHGEKVGSFTWYSFKEVQMFVEYLACAIDKLGAKQFDIIGVCSENRLEWCIIDLCCISKVCFLFSNNIFWFLHL